MSALRRVIQHRRRDGRRNAEPWQLDIPTDAEGGVGANVPGGRLFHYLAGGGLRAFGGSFQRYCVERRQNRFLACAGVLALAWLAGWYF